MALKFFVVCSKGYETLDPSQWRKNANLGFCAFAPLKPGIQL